MKLIRNILMLLCTVSIISGCEETEPENGGNEGDFVSRFQKHVCIMEFTGAWCAQCPEGATTINYLVNRTFKDKAFALAFHNNDFLTVPAEAELGKMFRIGELGYPSFLIDMNIEAAGTTNDGGCSTAVDKALYDTPVHCGASVRCSLDKATSKVNVEAKIYSEKETDYSIAVYVIEDKVIGEQKLSTGEVREDYSHRHVVRKMLSEKVTGDALGKVAKDKESGKSYEFVLDESWNPDNVSVAVLAISEGGKVNNMAICSVENGQMGYKYITDNE